MREKERADVRKRTTRGMIMDEHEHVESRQPETDGRTAALDDESVSEWMDRLTIVWTEAKDDPTSAPKNIQTYGSTRSAYKRSY